MKKLIVIILLSIVTPMIYAMQVDLKNIIAVEGFQDNPILGLGIVSGLKGSGDDKGDQTKEIAARIFNFYGFNISPDQISPKNSAAVIVSAVITPFSSIGSKVDIKIVSLCNAKSLEGGELIITPLFGGENKEDIYAIASGSIMIDKTSKSVSGYIPQGAIIQKEIDHLIMNTNREFKVNVIETLSLNAVNKVAEAIRRKFPDAIRKTSQNKLTLALPDDMDFNQFIAEIYKLKADVDEEPSVIIDSRSGIIVSGGNVVISEAAISFKGTKVAIGGQQQAQVPAWGGSQETTKQEGSFKVFSATATVSELVESMNKTGASNNDLISLLQLLYKNGNLKARLIVQ